LTVLLDWYPNPDHAPLLVAQEQGFFKQQGLNVKLVSPTDPGDPLKLVAAGKADIGITYQPTLLMAIDADIPVVRIGTLIATPLNAVAVLQNSNIHNISDLKGKKIGYSVDGTDHVMLDTMLKNAGLTEKDVTLINVHYGLTQALMGGKVDAITGIMRNFEPFEMADNGKPARVFNYEDYGVPLYDELIFVTGKNNLTDPRLPKFLAALTQATNYLVNHPQSSWQAFAKAYPDLNNNFNHQAWFATLSHFDLTPAALDKSRYQHFAEYFHQQGVIKNVPPLNNYAVELAY
jgi:putative hydroxymethylpyrimidine transport system substrate-binding protein